MTRGLVQQLDERQLRGVMAHEFAHIIQRDTLISAIAATVAGAITLLANMAQWAALFGGGRDGERHPLALVATALLADRCHARSDGDQQDARIPPTVPAPSSAEIRWLSPRRLR